MKESQKNNRDNDLDDYAQEFPRNIKAGARTSSLVRIEPKYTKKYDTHTECKSEIAKLKYVAVFGKLDSKINKTMFQQESIGYGHESWNEEGNDSELIEMEASEVELQQVTEEPSQFSSQEFQENQHPNGHKINSKKSPLMNQLSERLKIISKQKQDFEVINNERENEEIKIYGVNIGFKEANSQEMKNNSESIEEEKRQSKSQSIQSSKFINKLLIPFITPDISHKDTDGIECKQEYYFSCHERLINDNASKDNAERNNESSNVFTASFLAKINQRDTESMPDLTRTTLGEEIEYDLYDYKLNESSKITENSKDVKSNEPNKYVSIQFYTNKKSLVHPKFMNSLNTAKKTEVYINDLNASDEFEAEEIINSLKCNNERSSEKHGVSKHKLITPKNKIKPFCYTAGSSSQGTQDTKYENRKEPDGMEYTFGRRKDCTSKSQIGGKFAKVYKVDFPISLNTDDKVSSRNETDELGQSSRQAITNRD